MVFSFFANNSYRVLRFNSVVFTYLKISNVFETGQSTSSMARIMKANQMSKLCASSNEYPHVEKIKNLCEQNFKGTVAQPTVTAKELSSRQKEKPQGKKKNKEKPHGKKKKTHGICCLYVTC